MSSLCCCEKVFTRTNTWMTGKDLLKHEKMLLMKTLDFEMENKCDYCGLYVQSNKFLLFDAFEHFQTMCNKLYKFDRCCFIHCIQISMTSYNEDSNKGHVLEVDVEYIERLREFHDDLPFSH